MDLVKNLNCNQIKIFINLEIIGPKKKFKSKNLNKKKSAIKDALEHVV